MIHVDIEILPSPFADGRAPAIAASLGPFAPPEDFSFEPEFEQPVPRSIPPQTRAGHHSRMNESAKWACLTFAALFLLLGTLPQIKDLTVYIVPLAFVNEIGLVLLAMWGIAAVWTFIERFAALGPYRYVSMGLPFVARVLTLVKSPTRISNGAISHYAIFVLVEYREPQTGALFHLECQSRQFRALEHGHYTTSFRVGDYVTVVLLPGEALKLYCFLDLSPDVGLVRQVDARGLPMPLVTIPFLLGLLAVCLSGLTAAISYDLYVPLDIGMWEALPAFSICFIAIAAGWSFGASQYQRNRQRRVAELNAEAVAAGYPIQIEPPRGGAGRAWSRLLLLIAIAALGALAMLYTTYAINALCDDSAARETNVEILRFESAIHHSVFRTYTIEFFAPQLALEGQFCTSPERIADFQRTGVKTGIAEIHRGFLGWRWIKTIRPELRQRGK